MRRFLVPNRALSFVRERIVTVATASMLLIVAALGAIAFGWSTAGMAQNPPATSSNTAQETCCWIDSKTGKQVNTIPSGSLHVNDSGHLADWPSAHGCTHVVMEAKIIRIGGNAVCRIVTF